MNGPMLGGLAVMFVFFPKEEKPDERRIELRKLFALYLASLAVWSLFFATVVFAPSSHRPFAHVDIRTNGDAHPIVAAIQSLHRPDVKVETHGEFDGFTALGLFGAAFGWMLAIGLTLFFYKLICRWMGIPHDI